MPPTQKQPKPKGTLGWRRGPQAVHRSPRSYAMSSATADAVSQPLTGRTRCARSAPPTGADGAWQGQMRSRRVKMDVDGKAEEKTGGPEEKAADIWKTG